MLCQRETVDQEIIGVIIIIIIIRHLWLQLSALRHPDAGMNISGQRNLIMAPPSVQEGNGNGRLRHSAAC